MHARNRKIMMLRSKESQDHDALNPGSTRGVVLCLACQRMSAHAVKLLIIEHFTDGASDATWILLVIVVI